MKNPPVSSALCSLHAPAPARTARARKAFTLVELLVVISIIALLAGMTFAGVQHAILAARRAQAYNDMAQINTAVQFYYTEYGKYPLGSGIASGADVTYGIGNNANNLVIDVLRCTGTWAANDAVSSTPQNPRQQKFIEPKLVSIAKGGVYDNLSGVGDGNWYDPWGRQYVLFLDGDYAGDITVGSVLSNVGAAGGKVPVGVGAASVGYYYSAKPSAAVPFDMSQATVKKGVFLSWQ